MVDLQTLDANNDFLEMGSDVFDANWDNIAHHPHWLACACGVKCS